MKRILLAGAVILGVAGAALTKRFIMLGLAVIAATALAWFAWAADRTREE
jgi:hypothetical protein